MATYSWEREGVSPGGRQGGGGDEGGRERGGGGGSLGGRAGRGDVARW